MSGTLIPMDATEVRNNSIFSMLEMLERVPGWCLVCIHHPKRAVKKEITKALLRCSSPRCIHEMT
jgi:hypothetical protein